MQHQEPVSVLIAPLDWGLGHATRCIPIIRELVKQGARVLIVSSGPQKVLLRAEFPDLEILELPGYGIRYRKGIFLKWGLVFKIPSILKQIKRENRWLAEIIHSRRLDAVISDNRYGMFHPEVYSIFLTHQLAIRTGMGPMVDRIIMKWNYRLIGNFSVCWVPDWPGEISLSGRLSHPSKQPPFPLVFIGILSRFSPLSGKSEKNTLLVLLSGPEPQRTQFEDCILPQLKNLSLQCTVVRGLPGTTNVDAASTDHIRIIDHLRADELNVLLSASEFIITRSGYSTIMDLVRLGKNALLVPTPGQTEQEYLGIHLQEMQWMLSFQQKNFDIEKAIQQFRASRFTKPHEEKPELEKAVEGLINHCNVTKSFSVRRSALGLSLGFIKKQKLFFRPGKIIPVINSGRNRKYTAGGHLGDMGIRK